MAITFSISTNSSVPIYRQIVEKVATAFVSGKISANDPLPSVRALAEQLVLNPNTVARAYAELVREGVIESHAGRGMVVAQRRQVYAKAEQARRLEIAATALVNEAILIGCDEEQVVAIIHKRFKDIGKTAGRAR